MGWCDNLDAHWDEAVAEVGMGTARVWKLYMAGCILGFDRNVVQLHQILGVKLKQGRLIGNAPAPQLGARRRAREDVSVIQGQLTLPLRAMPSGGSQGHVREESSRTIFSTNSRLEQNSP